MITIHMHTTNTALLMYPHVLFSNVSIRIPAAAVSEHHQPDGRNSTSGSAYLGVWCPRASTHTLPLALTSARSRIAAVQHSSPVCVPSPALPCICSTRSPRDLPRSEYSFPAASRCYITPDPPRGHHSLVVPLVWCAHTGVASTHTHRRSCHGRLP